MTVEPTSRKKTTLFVILSVILGIGLTVGVLFLTGLLGNQEETTNGTNTSALEEEVKEIEKDKAETEEPLAEDSADESTEAPEEKPTTTALTADTAQEACNAELIDAHPGASVQWDDQRSVQEKQGDLWFMKAPATGGSHPGTSWVKCKVGGTVEQPEFVLLRMD